MEVHTGILGEERDDLAARLVERTSEKPGPAHEPVRLEPAVGERFGQLISNERTAQHDRHLGLRNTRDHALRIIEVLEVEEVGRPLGAGRAQGIWPAAGRDEQAVVRYFSAGLGVDGLLVEAHLVHFRFEAQVDPVLRVPLHITHVDPLLEQHTAQVPRQRDAVVEGVGLVVDHQDLRSRIELAQLFGRVGPGRAVADDDEAGGVGAQFRLLVC